MMQTSKLRDTCRAVIMGKVVSAIQFTLFGSV
jgi:hypothetical protein